MQVIVISEAYMVHLEINIIKRNTALHDDSLICLNHFRFECSFDKICQKAFKLACASSVCLGSYYGY